MAFLSSLQLPSATQVCVNLPKNLLKKHDFAESLLDDIVVQGGKTQCIDRALIAPRTCAIPSYADDTRLYDEIHVLEIAVSQRKNLDKLEEALFRAFPYALILIARHDDAERITLAHFRTNAADKSLNVLTDIIHSRWFDANVLSPLAIPYAALPKDNLYAFYSAIFDAIVMDNVRQVWPEYAQTAQTARLALQLYQIYDKQRSEASAALKREKQMHHCLEYNRKLLALEDKIQKIPSLCADELSACMASYAPNLA